MAGLPQGLRDGPIPCALVGMGTRARKLYLPLVPAIAPWLRITAVCSPNPANVAAAAESLGVPGFTTLDALTGSGLARAAIVLSPIESHHAASLTLSAAGIHHLVETSMASTVRQAEEMVAAARAAGVTLSVAENHFRFPFDRLARQVVASGVIGDVGRVTCYHDQVGFHGHARWIHFFGAAPERVSSTTHRMPTARHRESERRIHDSEDFRICQMHFPGGAIAIDMGGNLKGLLGRTPRPGFTEIAGATGTIFRAPTGNLGAAAELRCCSPSALATTGRPDHVAPFRDEMADGVWTRSEVVLPDGVATWENPWQPPAVRGPKLREWDGPAVMEILAGFAREVAGEAPPEFAVADAVAATRVEAACRESARRDGAPIELAADMRAFESEAMVEAAIRRRFGVDPYDAAATIAHHFPPAA